MGDESDIKELKRLMADRRTDSKAAKSRRKRELEIGPKKVGDILSFYFKANPQVLAKVEESRALHAWESIVGHSASLVSKAVKINGHSLVVIVKDPMWMQQLLLVKRELLKRYRQQFPKLGIKDIFFTRFERA